MSPLKHLILLVIATLVNATNVLPPAPHHEIRTPTFVELHDVILKARSDINPRGIHDRLNIPANPVQKQIQSPDSSGAAVKRLLLGARQSCDAGYGYCYSPSSYPGRSFC